MDEKQLLENLKKGDRLAFKQLYTDYYSMIRTLVMRNNGTDNQAQDLFQETLITLFENIRKKDFKLTAKLGTYIYSIARFKWLHELRDKKGIDSIDDTHKEIVDEGDLILEKQIIEQKHVLVKDLFKTISEDCQKLLSGYYFKKESLISLAKQLGYKKDFAKVKKKRCLEGIRKKMLAHPDYLSLILE